MNEPTDNMRIWNKVEKTDPKHTKAYNSGGYRGTAITSMYNVKRATEIFGPIGHGWGFDVGEPEYVADAESKTMIVQIKVTVWYMQNDKCGHVSHYGATKMAYQASSRRMVDEDAVKKAVTDALGKALSMLGFSADVWLGKFDDPAYVRDLENGGMDTPPAPPPPNKAAVSHVRTAAISVVLDIVKLKQGESNQWTAEQRAHLSETVKLICGKAGIASHDTLSSIPGEEIEAFASAAVAVRGKS